ncbi:MAG: YdiU family protein [Cyanothece sp. SIO1E1]|nr:YdiU family protein [Cyanothece sp. SIO1E1]
MAANPLLQLDYESALEDLGDDYFDIVSAAEFPSHILRFRNDPLLPMLGLQAGTVSDQHFIQAFGQFQGRFPFLALRYHGYQFGDYNPYLGDGRGFLYGQVRGIDHQLYDLGTKGSGTTPYSRNADGCLTLKGGVREALAAEALHYSGVRTSRCLSLIETGEALWRGDEPSPTRSSVMVRCSRSHIRFGTFERLEYLRRKDLTQKLLDHVVEQYYPDLQCSTDRYAQFYAELVQRVAELAAQWMSVGFCHGVLNTDNMSITGESFDYGPYAFIDRYDPGFTAASFDYFKRYCYGNQPLICRLNLEMLQRPLQAIISPTDMEFGLAQFDQHYHITYRQRMMNKLGFDQLPVEMAEELLKLTLQVLKEPGIGYHDFFITLRQQFAASWRQDPSQILSAAISSSAQAHLPKSLESWRQFYHNCLRHRPEAELDNIGRCLRQHNPTTVLVRPEIEAIWEPIATTDNWIPFYDLLKQIQRSADF